MLIAILGVAALAAGATVASAHRGRGHDHNGQRDDHLGGRGRGAAVHAAARSRGHPRGSRSKAEVVLRLDRRRRRDLPRHARARPSRRHPGGAGNSAVGMKVPHGKLYVAGGPTGTITVYDIATKAAVATFQTGAGGFLNDLVVTRRGDVSSPTPSGRRSGT